MQRFYILFRRGEMYISTFFLLISTFIIFAAAMFRTFGHPINWASDVAIILFVWSTMLGADIALRNKALVSVDLLLTRLPHAMQRLLTLLILLCMAGTCIYFICYGFKLASMSAARMLPGLPSVSYSYLAASIPVSMCLMLISVLRELYFLCSGRTPANKSLQDVASSSEKQA